ncbi:MAG: carboxypeptidase-like regulatory domain-containing protein [Anaerolineae bacterium]|nr:carboxypeptidase-like regulatory domain-containing protein [Anaerolineae bacterium]MDW8099854.1 carboxypeptidase-like regulatory domain-containing protein [Anaerolineae bacterium]
MFQVNTSHVLWFVLLFAFTLTGCAPWMQAMPANPEPPEVLTPTPDTALTWTSPIPSPATTPSIGSAPMVGTGTVSGSLDRPDGTPLRKVILYAGAIDMHDALRLASVDPLVDPRAETDATGTFVFENLVPGEYALIAQSPFGLVLLQDANGKPIIFQLQAGQVLSLGSLVVEYRYPDGE